MITAEQVAELRAAGYSHPGFTITLAQLNEMQAVCNQKVFMPVKIRAMLNLLGNSGKTSEAAILQARNAAEWLAAGGFSRYSNEDCDILQHLCSSFQFDN